MNKAEAEFSAMMEKEVRKAVGKKGGRLDLPVNFKNCLSKEVMLSVNHTHPHHETSGNYIHLLNTAFQLRA